MRNEILFALVVSSSLVGCASGSGDPDVLTYDEYKARAYQEPDSGVFIINGDEVIETEEAMQQSYSDFLQSISDAQLREDGLGTISQELAINRVGGRDDKWSAAQATNLTYCVSRTSFGSRYNTVVNALNSATAAWESATGNGVNFVHNTALDNNCTAGQSGVVFDVRQVSTTQYLARAFFPSNARSSRNILISSSSFGNISPWTLTGILRHELGHTIGFRHEHTRPESGTCFEDNNWRGLTAYDRASVMHYPQCNGSQTGDLVLTNLDKQGANSVY
jgi:serralysin